MAKSKKEKELEKKIEKEVEKQVEEKVKKYFDSDRFGKKVGKSKGLKIFGELLGYVLTLIFLYKVFPALSFVTKDYSVWLPIGFWAATMSTVFKLFKHLVGVNFLERSFEIIGIIVTVYSTYKLIEIFPLDFTKIGYGQFNIYFRYFLYFVIFTMTISIFANFIRIFFPKKT